MCPPAVPLALSSHPLTHSVPPSAFSLPLSLCLPICLDDEEEEEEEVSVYQDEVEEKY
jgi:hypothetical protein